MKNLSDTIARLTALRKSMTGSQEPVTDRLAEMTGFGTNPGKLRAMTYVPAGMAPKAPLVVVLHGCTQNAAGYDHGSGWSQLADAHGLALLFPEQQRSNNPNLCFNWFQPDDHRRGRGEALSIRQMIGAMLRNHDIDPARIFVTGLSAGGAMAAVMLAAYPELFAGGAVIAGLPYGSASSVPEAFDRMRGEGAPSSGQLIARARAASPHSGPLPTLSVWHGSNDTTVSPLNADALVAQWRGLHGLSDEPARVERVESHTRRVWSDHRRDVIEQYEIAGMAHGTPLAAASGFGVPGPFLIEAGISSTLRIAAFWDLVDLDGAGEVPVRASGDVKPVVVPAESGKRGARQPLTGTILPPVSGQSAGTHARDHAWDSPRVRKVIEDALRAGGLMR